MIIKKIPYIFKSFVLKNINKYQNKYFIYKFKKCTSKFEGKDGLNSIDEIIDFTNNSKTLKFLADKKLLLDSFHDPVSLNYQTMIDKFKEGQLKSKLSSIFKYIFFGVPLPDDSNENESEGTKSFGNTKNITINENSTKFTIEDLTQIYELKIMDNIIEFLFGIFEYLIEKDDFEVFVKVEGIFMGFIDSNEDISSNILVIKCTFKLKQGLPIREDIEKIFKLIKKQKILPRYCAIFFSCLSEASKSGNKFEYLLYKFKELTYRLEYPLDADDMDLIIKYFSNFEIQKMLLEEKLLISSNPKEVAIIQKQMQNLYSNMYK